MLGVEAGPNVGPVPAPRATEGHHDAHVGVLESFDAARAAQLAAVADRAVVEKHEVMLTAEI